MARRQNMQQIRLNSQNFPHPATKNNSLIQPAGSTMAPKLGPTLLYRYCSVTAVGRCP